jgi:GTP-binding protein
LADVGIVGLPNVGKSTLISRASAARPKIADYPFTTLVPNLGVVRLEEGVSFVIADLPGLVEGAHRGAGRGHEFLRHAERTRLLIHVVDLTAPTGSPYEDFLALNQELALYGEDLAGRPQLVALNKVDLCPPEAEVSELESLLQEEGYEVFRVSALTGEGVVRLMGRAARMLAELPGTSAEEGASPMEVGEMRAEPLRVVRLAEGCYEVGGEEVERAMAMTNLGNEEALRHLHRRLERMGVMARLRDLGAKDGDRVRIGGVELDFVE